MAHRSSPESGRDDIDCDVQDVVLQSLYPSRRSLLLALLGFALWALCSVPAQAQDCSDYGGVLDGFAGDVAPSQLQIDQTCTIRNYPASNPLGTNFSFFTQPGQNPERWLVVFDNVVHTGQMSCNSVLEHKIWFTNGSSTTIQENCQNLLIPVEKIDKQNPPGDAASIGVPFTYTLTMPVLFDPATGNVINNAGSVNRLHGVTLTDDLNETGVDLTYVSHIAYLESTGASVSHTFSNVDGLLTFDNFPIIDPGEQIIIELTVVLEDTPANAPGTQFINTAKWDFGRLIDGVFYEPLPGEWGISPPMTISAPQLAVTKTGPATLGRTLNLGEWGQFAIDVRNTGLIEAWNATLVDRLPNGPMGGMCNVTPQILSAQVFAADGVTAVPGKGPLVEGTDFTVSYSGAPFCELDIEILTGAGAIGPGERLIIAYRTQLDSDSQDGVALTNVVGATQWFNGDASVIDREVYTRTVTNGTVGTVDHQDAHTVTVALYGFFFEKTVANLTSGANPATTAAPGDTLRYSLRLQATDVPLTDFRFYDDLGALNPLPAFVPGSLTVVPGTLPPGADASGTNPSGGTNGAGILDIRDIDLAAFGAVTIQFDIVLDASLPDGTVVTNQADLIAAVKVADSDDPNVNGQSDPNIAGDEDPTQIVTEAVPPEPLIKANTQTTAAVGEQFRYLVTIPSIPHSAPLYDVRIIDPLAASAADLQFVSVARVAGPGSWTPTNTGSGVNVVIEDPLGGIDIPAGEQIVIEITVLLLDTSTNVAGLQFTNTASFTYNLVDGNLDSERQGGPGATEPMTIVGPDLTFDKTGPVQMRNGIPGTFALNVHNIGTSPAYGLTIDDYLPSTALGGMCEAAPTAVTAQLFESDGVTPAAPALVQGADFAVSFDGDPACLLTLTMLSPAAAIGSDQRLIVTYETSLDAGTTAPALVNIAGATRWFSADISTPNDEAREFIRTLTDGTVGILDHEDAHTTIVNLAVLRFEKSVVNVTTGETPGTTATPGDTLRYSLLIENVTDVALTDFSIADELDRLNASPAFQPGTLALVNYPAGADVSGTNATGGAAGTGLLDVRNLSIGGLGETLLIEFEVVLAPAIPNGTYVLNQAQLSTLGFLIAISDDPNINGPADPNFDGDEDPTRIQITSAPYLDIDKVSAYATGDPNVLLAGETLRYTITVANIGTDNATGVTLRDQIPANTVYVAGSTTLNGAAVPDATPGVSPLGAGMTIRAPGSATPGSLPADPSQAVPNVAVIVFDVVVDSSVVDGTIISNQGFVSAPAGGILDQPSDDPRTPIVDDPTRDVVGALPLIYAEKSAALQVDLGTPNVIDPGDTLRYTIAVYNNGSVDATEVMLTDAVPANTTYVADTTTLNGLAVGQPDGGVSPLASGISVSSGDLTPPLPGVGGGTLTAGQSAVLQFDLLVDDGVAPGTLITNQAVASSYELPDVPTDGDGNPATGPEPTIVVVGPGQQLTITKQVAVVGGGPAVAGATVEYTVRALNVASVPASYVVLTDDLDMATPNYLQYVPGSATMNGSAAGVTFTDPMLTADFGATYGDLAAGAEVILRFQAVIDPNLAIGTIVTNTGVAKWNDPPMYAQASVSIAVGGVPGVGLLSGTGWHDRNFDDVLDPGERLLPGWTVDLYRNGNRIHTTFTASDGTYRIAGVAPNYTTSDQYELRFVAPGAGASTALLGFADSDFTDYLQRIADIVVESGGNLPELNLPIDPNGVVYDSVTRTPVSGVIVALLDAGAVELPSSCFDDPAQQNQITLPGGYYKFDLNFSSSACPGGGDYLIRVTAPNAGYVAGYSQIIPPTADATTVPLSVPLCPGSAQDAVPGTTQYCEVQPSELAPPPAVAARAAGTEYFVHLMLDASQTPGSSQIFNNHIPIDPDLNDAISISKTTPMIIVSRGQLVPYTITVNNEIDFDLQDLTIADRFPAGFRYVDGSARIDGIPMEPVVNGRELSWTDLGLVGAGQHRVQLLLVVGAGISEGEYVNRAQAIHGLTGNPLSGEATATVRLAPDPTFDCTDVMGKVFDDANRNGTQDLDEAGIGGVRLVTMTGIAATTDEHGRYHITCAAVPREGRGSNFVVKVDGRTLPTGFRSSTPLVQMERATRGKALRFNFGASIHRVVSLDISDPIFVPEGTDLRAQWVPRIDLLLAELQKGPATLRLSYLADVESARLVDERIAALEARISTAWQTLNCCYELVIEPEIFWRRGEPPELPRAAAADVGEGR